MHQEKYSLTWHTYSDHLRSMMKELMMNEDFSDVTLVTEDKKHIKANINILSTCSPVFKDILKKERNSSPIIYLRGVQHFEMESIMQFIYLGEATFHEERMDELLTVAESLEIENLCNTRTNNKLCVEPLPCEQVPSTQNLKELSVISDNITGQAKEEGDVVDEEAHAALGHDVGHAIAQLDAHDRVGARRRGDRGARVLRAQSDRRLRAASLPAHGQRQRLQQIVGPRRVRRARATSGQCAVWKKG